MAKISTQWFTAVVICLLMQNTGLAASIDFSASDNHVVKGDTVEFTFTYDPEGDSDADSLEIEMFGDTDELEYSKEFDSLEDKISEKTEITMETAGYFEAEARFIFTYTEPDGSESTERRTLGPVEINVANWKFPAEGTIGGIESTPVVSADASAVYFGSNDHFLYAVSTEDGSRIWKKNLGGDVNSTPALDSDGYIYVGSDSGHVYCLEPESGAVEWRFPAGSDSGRGHFISSPALDEEKNRLYIGSTDNHLYALDMNTGQRAWRYKTGAKIISSPVVGYDHTVYAGSLDGFLYAVNPGGSLKWRFDAGNRIEGSPALDEDGTIFFGTSSFRGEADAEGKNGLYAVSTAGQEKWFAENLQGFPGAPVISGSGTLSAGSWDNLIHGIDRSGGRLIMYKEFDDDVLSSPALASNGYLFAGAKDGVFYALDFDEGDERSGRNEYWDYSLPLPIGASSPAVANGYVYIGTCRTEGTSSSGILYSFLCNSNTGGSDIWPSERDPWPQQRNNRRNTGMTGFREGTAAPEVAKTDPPPGTTDFNSDRTSITARFSMPMDPQSIHDPANDIYGFTVEPFDAEPEEFEVDCNEDEDKTACTLTLPEGESFERETQYTATIKSRAHAKDDSDRHLLYDYEWTFEHDPEESHDNSHDRFACFISSLWETSPLDLLADPW